MRLPSLEELEAIIAERPKNSQRRRIYICIGCGINFARTERSRRKDTKYHDNACKQKAYRARVKTVTN